MMAQTICDLEKPRVGDLPNVGTNLGSRIGGFYKIAEMADF
jgi:hypothetical protein